MEAAPESALDTSQTAAGLLARVGSAAQRESALFALGVGVIGVHLVDDSFLQPEPGTSAADHLASGLVPIAVLGLAAAAYSRLRAGVRGTIALAVGAFGVATGAEAAYDTIAASPSGDDFTGLLAIPAALLLLALGTTTLWRTRRLDEPRRRRYARRALIGAAAVLATFVVVVPITFSYGYTHLGRAAEPPVDYGAPAQAVSFVTSDGVELAGSYIPSRNGAAVIAFPGRNGPARHARMLARHGYGVLLFDPRGTGESEGDPYRWGGERDVKAALAYLGRRNDVDPDRIGGLGLSLGGELLLQTAGESKALRAVVSEGAGIRSIREQLDKQGARKWLSVPFWTVFTAANTVFSNHGPPPDLEDLVARIAPRPVFFIYATQGAVGGEELNAQFYAAAGRPKLLWAVPQGGHTGALDAYPKQYERRVIAFFDRALLDGK